MKGVTLKLSDWGPQSLQRKLPTVHKSITYPEGPSFSLDSTNSCPIFIFSHSSLRVLILRGFMFPRFGLSFFSFYNKKNPRKSFVKPFPMFFSKIPSTSMDAHPRDALPGQHIVTTEFIIELLCLNGQWREMRGNDSYRHLGRCKKMVKTKQPMRVSSACAAALAPGALLGPLAAMLMGVWGCNWSVTWAYTHPWESKGSISQNQAHPPPLLPAGTEGVKLLLLQIKHGRALCWSLRNELQNWQGRD